MTDQYKCQSYYDDENKLQDCTCGKCATPTLETQIREILQENIAGTVWYESRQCEKILLQGLRKTEKDILSFIRSIVPKKQKMKSIIKNPITGNSSYIKGFNSCRQQILTKIEGGI